MLWLWWILISICFFGSLIGIFVPVIPGVILIWIGFFLYEFGIAIPGKGLPSSFWWGMGILTALIILVDLLASLIFVKKYGGSKWGVLASIGGALVGPFVLGGPWGIFIGPILGVFFVEWFLSRNVNLSMKISLATLLAFLSSGVAKVVLQLTMIIWFLILI